MHTCDWISRGISHKSFILIISVSLFKLREENAQLRKHIKDLVKKSEYDDRR